jgi:hypothetical protein
MGDAKGFMAALDLGTLPPDAFNVWTAMKNELREAADINEIGLGQFAPRGRTSATEISATQQSSSALVRSVAQTCETRFLDPLLDLVWKTGVQYMSKNDKVVEAACDTQWFQAILAQRKDFVSRPITFQARGISTLIARSQQLKAIISILQLIASNPQLTQAFLQVANLQRLVELMFELSNIDLRRLQITEREQMMQSVMSQLQGAQQDGQPGASAGGQQQMQDVAGAMGVGQQGGGG